MKIPKIWLPASVKHLRKPDQGKDAQATVAKVEAKALLAEINKANIKTQLFEDSM